MIGNTITNDVTNRIRQSFRNFQSISGSSASYITPTTMKNPHFFYMGTASIGAKTAEVLFQHDSNAIAGGAYAHIGIFRGKFTLGGDAVLTRIGLVEITNYLGAPSNTTIGVHKTLNFVLDELIVPGDQLWIGIGISASTQPRFRAPLDTTAFTYNLGCIQTTGGQSLAALTGPFTTANVVGSAGSYFPQFHMDIY